MCHTTLMNYSNELNIGQLDWGINTRRIQLISNNYPVGLGHRPEPQLTLPGWIGSSTRAYTHYAWSDWDIDTGLNENSAQSNWVINTSLHKLCSVGLIGTSTRATIRAFFLFF